MYILCANPYTHAHTERDRRERKREREAEKREGRSKEREVRAKTTQNLIDWHCSLPAVALNVWWFVSPSRDTLSHL